MYRSQELHDDDFVIEGKAGVVFLEEVVQLFGKSLRVAQQLEGREIWDFPALLPFRFCSQGSDKSQHE